MEQAFLEWLLNQAPAVAVSIGALYFVYRRQCKTEDFIVSLLKDCQGQMMQHLEDMHLKGE